MDSNSKKEVKTAQKLAQIVREFAKENEMTTLEVITSLSSIINSAMIASNLEEKEMEMLYDSIKRTSIKAKNDFDNMID